MNHPLKYAFKVWQTAVFVSPGIIIISGILPGNDRSDIWFILGFSIVFGMILSIPSALLLWLAAAVTARARQLSWIHKKLLLALTGVMLTQVPFLFLYHNRILAGPENYFAIIYALTIAVSIWLYKLEPAENTEEHAY